MQFRLLGPVEVEDDGRPLVLGSAKQRALLAILLLHANEVVSRDLLIDELWGEQPPASASHSLEVYVSRLRKTLQPDGGERLVVTRPGGYLLRLEPEQLDLERFERLVEEGRRSLADGNYERAAERLAEALALWRGPALGDLAYELFAGPEIERLEEQRLAALEERIEAELALGRHGALIGELEAVCRKHPLRERLHGQLMLGLYRCGRQAEALAAYQRARRTLVDEFGLETSRQLHELERSILRQDEALTLTAPILSGERHKGSNLPVQPTSFIGRERELAQLVSLLARDEVRLLTVTGPGGCGKTRLALEAARKVSDEYQDGVCWVPLAALRDPALVMNHVGQALGSQEQPRVQIADRQLLLLLDNFEHLTGAAPRVAELIAACPKLKLLVTSREPLHVAGEREYLMPMLANEEAVELFRQRAHSTGPEETVLAICRKLDLLPLAIELAAARTKLLSPDTLLARLDQSLPVLTGGPGDAPQRQRTLRATIAWSYELLTPSEQVLFTRLAVFAGACTLEAAEEVCQADLDTLQALIDKNLLRRQNDRYEMLETIREYASEVLEASTDRDGVRDRHAAFYGARARVFANTSSDRFGQFVAYDRLPDVERDFLNYRAALGWMKTRGVVRAEAQLAADLVSPLFFLGFWSEGRTLLADVLTRVGDDQPVSVRLELLGGVAAMAVRQGAGEEAWEYARRHLELARRSGNAHELLHPLNSTGTTAARVGKLETASLLFREAEAKARELGNHFELGRALLNLAWISEARGATEAAAGLLEEAISEARAAGGGSLLAGCWTTLASQLVLAGRTDDAAAALAEAFDTLRTIGTKEHLTVALEAAACIAANRGLTKRGAQLLAAAERIRSETGAQDTAFADVLRERLQEELNDSTFQHEWAKGRRMGAREAAEEGLTLLESNSCAIRTRVAQGTFPNTGPRGI